MRYLGFALLASPFVALAAAITYLNGLAMALVVFGMVAAITAVILLGCYLAFEY